MCIQQINEQICRLEDCKQRHRFTWMCGMRALPFLSVNRDFAYWSSDKKQKYLYSIFFALDVAALSAFWEDRAIVGPYIAKAYSDIIDVKDSALTNTSIGRYAIGCGKTHTNASGVVNESNIAKIVFLAVDSAIVSSDPNGCYSKRNAVSAAAEAIKVAEFAKVNVDVFGKILLKSIEDIKEGWFSDSYRGTHIYGPLWDNFQKDLKTNGCVYWAEFYKNVFNSGIGASINKKLLERHISVPDGIKAEGAASVGRHLDELGKQVIKSALSDKTSQSQNINAKDIYNNGVIFMNQSLLNINGDRNIVAPNSPGAIFGLVGGSVSTSTGSSNLPTTVTKEQFEQILKILDDFTKSNQAGELKTKDTQVLQTKIVEMRNLGHESGWERFRRFWSDVANTTTIGTAIGAYLAELPGITPAILSMFGL